MKLIKLLSLGLLLVIFQFANSDAGDITGFVKAKRSKYLPKTVVYIESAPGEFTPPKENPVMDQQNMIFSPHILPVLVGTTVDFLNSDDVAHNVFSPDESADKMNLGTWPKGDIRSFTFKNSCEKVCDPVLLCNVHPEMEAYVVVIDNPYFSKANDSGFFKISGVPPGKYNVKVWHPKRKAQDVSIVMPDSGSVEIEFTLKKK